MVIPVCWRNCWRSARSLPPSCSQKRSRTKGRLRLAASAASSLSSSASRRVAADHPSHSDGAATSAPAGQKQFGHRISLRVAPGALMLKLANHLARLRHTCAAHAPVGLPRRAEEARDRPGPVKIELQPLRAIDDVLQNQIVNGSIGVFIFGANVEQIAAGNAPGRSLRTCSPLPRHTSTSSQNSWVCSAKTFCG